MVLLVLRVAFSSAVWKHPYGQAQGYISYVILNPGQAASEDDPLLATRSIDACVPDDCTQLNP